MSDINIKLVRSISGSIKKQRATIEALGLKKIGQTVAKPDNDAVRGMIATVAHMVEISKG